jgi:hypothetical protein
MNEPWASSPVIALDVSDQGLLKVAGLPPSGSIRPLSMPDDRKVVLLGETFVRRHGMISTKWDLPPETLGNLGGQPIVALVSGEAKAWVQKTLSEQWLRELWRMGERLTIFSRAQEGRMKDSVVPFIDSTQAASVAGVSVKAAAMSGRIPSLFLSDRQLQLLSCLDGQKDIQASSDPIGLKSCRVLWTSNGELKSPKLMAQVDAVSRSSQITDAVLLKQELTRLIGLLQIHRTDPLDIGQSVRSQYRGVWTPDRWRDAFERADVQVNVHIS